MTEQAQSKPRFAVVRDGEAPHEVLKGAVVAIGNFDGVHRGHRVVIAAAQARAQAFNRPAAALTFEPHPCDYFAAASRRPELAPARIGTLRDKLGELAARRMTQLGRRDGRRRLAGHRTGTHAGPWPAPG